MRGTFPACALLCLASACAGCAGAPEEGRDGATLFRARACYRCHGESRSGTEMGPPLTDLREHWNVETLTAYIDNPALFREEDPRLTQLVARYNGRLMPGFRMPEEERMKLAEWLLAVPEAAAPEATSP